MTIQFEIGQTQNCCVEITESMVNQFAELTGDTNPVHLDHSYAEKTMFKKKIAHGMLVSSLFSRILGTQFPGEGTIYLGQTLKFKAPVFLGDKITATVKITSIKESKPIATIETVCVNQNDQTVITGEATVLLP